MTQGDSPGVRVLNRAFAADPAAIHALICNWVSCNQALADDSTVIVEGNRVVPDVLTVGALGLVNGVLAEAGLPMVAPKFSDEPDADGRRALLGFCECRPE